MNGSAAIARDRMFDRARHAQNCASFGPDSIDAYRQLGEDVLLLMEALDLVDTPYPLKVFPDLKRQDEVFAAMRAVNEYATEQFYAQTARQRGQAARDYIERHGD